MELGKTFRLTGKNFQSWKSFTLPVKGFTVIVGPSDRGKSAIIRSLRGVLRNEVGANQIQFGEKEASVILEPETGEVIALSRNSKTTNYSVGDEEFAKLNGALPPSMLDLKCGTVDVGGVKLDPIFAGQFDQQFMLSLTPNELNAIFGLFSSTEKLTAGKKAASSKNAELTATAKYIATETQESEAKQARLKLLLDDFDEAEVTFDALALKCRDTETVLDQLDDLKALDEKVLTLSAVLRPIPTTERLEVSVALARMIRGYIKAAANTAKYTEVVSVALPDTSKLVRLTELLPKVSKYIASAKRLKALKSAEKIDPEKWTKAVAALYEKKAPLSMLSNYLKTISSCTSIKASLEELNSQYQSLSAKLAELQSDGIQCPSCGHYFTTGEKHGN
jgi:energy-coupling factor transporter ATP-binding protein EcfA2